MITLLHFWKLSAIKESSINGVTTSSQNNATKSLTPLTLGHGVIYERPLNPLFSQQEGCKWYHWVRKGKKYASFINDPFNKKKLILLFSRNLWQPWDTLAFSNPSRTLPVSIWPTTLDQTVAPFSTKRISSKWKRSNLEFWKSGEFKATRFVLDEKYD